MNKHFLFMALFMLFSTLGWAQRAVVTGVVKDATGETAIGANVLVKGTTIGAITDIDGKFSINVPDTKNGVLQISYIGYSTKEVPMNGQTTFNVTLSEDSQALEEVVVVAYGTQKKETLTGSISSVDTEHLLSSPNTSVANSLQGNMPGITSIQESGQPGAEDPKIFIRGVGSLTEGNSSPLVLVDGVENSFSQMDPNEIESVTILKDASATAVFGVRGANGVILVTTRRGQKGKARISVSSNVGVLTPTRLLDLSNSYEFATAYNQKAANDGAPAPFNDYTVERFRLGDEPIMYPSHDWRDEYMKDFTYQTQHNVNVSGGTDRARYFVSAGYLFQDGMLEQFEGIDYDNGFSYNRFNYRANLDLDITTSTLLKLGIGGMYGKKHQAEGNDNMWESFNMSAPMASSGIDENGNVIMSVSSKYSPLLMDNNFLNHFYDKGYQDAMTNTSTFDLTLSQKLDFLTKGLSVEVKGTYNSSYGHTKKHNNSRPNYIYPYYKSELDRGDIPAEYIVDSSAAGFNPDEVPGYDKTVVYTVNEYTYRNRSFSESESRGRNWYMEGSLRYNRKFGDHTVGGLVLYNQSKKYYAGGGYDEIPRAYVGVVGRATYDYKSKYMAEVNVGYNGSENFAPDKRYGLFPAGSIGYTLSEEDFLKDNSVINYLKLRASVGLVGNDQMSSRFLYLPSTYDVNLGGKQGSGFNYYNYGYNFGVESDTRIDGANEQKLGNPDVTWETALKQNYGLDFYTLNDRLKISGDVFFEDRKDILITRNVVPILTGLTNKILPASNMGRVKNHGYEIELKWADKIKDFRYNVGFNMSYNENEIIEMDEVPKPEAYMSRTGTAVGARFGRVSDGLYQAEDFVYNEAGEFALNSKGQPVLVSGVDPGTAVYPGDVKYLDQNGDNLIDYRDEREIGDPKRPSYNFGLNLGANYKGFSLSATFAGVTGCDQILAGDYRPTDNRNYFTYLLEDSWSTENTGASFPRLSDASKTNNCGYDSQIWMRDGSYMKLKTLSLAYDITSKKVLNAIGAKALSVKLSGYNLLTFDYLDIIDPEGNPSDSDKYPIMRTVSLGVNLTF